VTALPNAFKRIRLNLARSKEFPKGSSRHGYEFVAPLDSNGHIDAQLWKQHRDHCRVRRFWEGEEDEHGLLVHQPGGKGHGRWVFDYDQPRIPMTKAVTVSARTFSGRVNMSRFAMKKARCIPFRWSRLSTRRDPIDRHAPCRKSAP